MAFAFLDVATAVGENIGSSALMVACRGLWRRASGAQIRITSPAINGTLENGRQLGGGWFYEVRGTLRRLPKGHRIWLVTQNENKFEFFPQGAHPVKYNPATREWTGLVTRNRPNPIIHALVAPPTANEFFCYYQDVGPKLEFKFPLHHIPTVCVNRASVAAQYPPKPATS
jgi:hypothetical protein